MRPRAPGCNTAPALANAVFHATGQRVREFPIRIESLLSTGSSS